MQVNKKNNITILATVLHWLMILHLFRENLK